MTALHHCVSRRDAQELGKRRRAVGDPARAVAAQARHARRARRPRAARARPRRRGCRGESHRRRAAARTRPCGRGSRCRCTRRSPARSTPRARRQGPIVGRAASARPATAPRRPCTRGTACAPAAAPARRAGSTREGRARRPCRRGASPRSSASFVCSVASTRWPVSEACTAICAVSRSRISPIMITSGSWRRIARSVRAKSSSMRGLTCVCATPSSAYSIGSSTVIMLTEPRGSRDSAAYSVVVLPEPVGPVTSTMPCGSRISRSIGRARGLAHAEHGQVEARGLLVEQAQHHALARVRWEASRRARRPACRRA